MNIQKIYAHLADSLKCNGNIIISRAYDGTVARLIMDAVKHKKVYLCETFQGLDAPSSIDLQHPNKNEIIKSHYFISKNNLLTNLIKHDSNQYSIVEIPVKDIQDTFCFAHVDLKQYNPTYKFLNDIWDKMDYGGTIFIENFNFDAAHSSHSAVKKFLSEHPGQYEITRQMMVNGKKEEFVAIKCYNSNNKNIINAVKRTTGIALVYRTGGVYTSKYVNILASSIRRNTTQKHNIYCLTDSSDKLEVDKVIKLENEYPGWWSKIELFRPSIFDEEKIFYLDLDTVINSNIQDIVNYNSINFTGLRDFYSLHSLGSGLMHFTNGDYKDLYMDFISHSQRYMSMYQDGDQRFLNEKIKNIDYFQDAFPNRIVSFKKHCYVNNIVKIPEMASIICFHGNPRPHMLENNEVIKKLWLP